MSAPPTGPDLLEAVAGDVGGASLLVYGQVRVIGLEGRVVEHLARQVERDLMWSLVLKRSARVQV